MILALFMLLLISNIAAAILAMKKEPGVSKAITAWVIINLSVDLICTILAFYACYEVVFPFIANELLSKK